MDQNNTITMFHAGRFTTEVAPPWLIAIRERRSKGMDWNDATLAVLKYTTGHVTIGESIFPLGELRAYPTPGGGRYVELSEREGTFAEFGCRRRQTGCRSTALTSSRSCSPEPPCFKPTEPSGSVTRSSRSPGTA